MAPLLALAAAATLFVLAAIVAPTRKRLALALSATAVLVPPWLAGPIPIARAALGLVTFVGAFRVIDLVRSREPWTVPRRVLHVLTYLDTRVLRRERPRLDAAMLLAAVAWSVPAAIALYVAHEVAPRWPTHPPWLRWGAGLVFVYATADTAYALLRAAYRALGFVTPPLHDWPVASTSVGEFWGARWARPVSRWLRETCFRPLARRGHPRLGLLLGFGVSALLHAYPFLVALGPMWAGVMFGYFFAQGVIALVETHSGTARWPRPARRAWAIVLLIATSPLFVEPYLRLVFAR
jgi:hypothetical protein